VLIYAQIVASKIHQFAENVQQTYVMIVLKEGEMMSGEDQTKKSKVIGHIDIQEMRSEYEPNYRVYVLLPSELKNLGEFDEDQWDYAYTLKNSDIDIIEIKKATRLPRELEAFQKALSKVLNETWHSYEIFLLSKENKESVEWEISDWLRDEGYQKAIVHPVKLSRVKSRKRILITEEMFEKALQKQKRKEK